MGFHSSHPSNNLPHRMLIFPASCSPLPASLKRASGSYGLLKTKATPDVRDRAVRETVNVTEDLVEQLGIGSVQRSACQESRAESQFERTEPVNQIAATRARAAGHSLPLLWNASARSPNAVSNDYACPFWMQYPHLALIYDIGGGWSLASTPLV